MFCHVKDCFVKGLLFVLLSSFVFILLNSVVEAHMEHICVYNESCGNCSSPELNQWTGVAIEGNDR